MILLHPVAAPRLRPAVKFLSEGLVGFWFRHSRVLDIRYLDGSAARNAIVRTNASKRTALATKPAGAYGDMADWHVPFGGACPDQRDKPPDDRPAKQQIYQKDSQGVGLVPPND